MLGSQPKDGRSQPAVESTAIVPPSLSLPKGGGAIRGIGEKISANPVTGTASLSIPIFVTAGRSDFHPQLALSYDSGAGNGPFGIGWTLSIPSISRRTEKGLPTYEDAEDSDTYLMLGAEDLVPALLQQNTEWVPDVAERTADTGTFRVRQYRPRVESLYARIEQWRDEKTGDVHWRSVSRGNITTLFGRTPGARVLDPNAPSHVFRWLVEEARDDKGNVIVYEYKAENTDNVDRAAAHEKNRLVSNQHSNRYLRRINYGNRTPNQNDWLFQVVFDYGEQDVSNPTIGILPAGRLDRTHFRHSGRDLRCEQTGCAATSSCFTTSRNLGMPQP